MPEETSQQTGAGRSKALGEELKSHRVVMPLVNGQDFALVGVASAFEQSFMFYCCAPGNLSAPVSRAGAGSNSFLAMCELGRIICQKNFCSLF